MWRFDVAMVLAYGFHVILRVVCEVLGWFLGQGVVDQVMEMLLALHDVQDHNTTFQLQHLQQRGNGGNLVGPVIDRLLG